MFFKVSILIARMDLQRTCGHFMFKNTCVTWPRCPVSEHRTCALRLDQLSEIVQRLADVAQRDLESYRVAHG
jgi:hypothetical protein